MKIFSLGSSSTACRHWLFEIAIAFFVAAFSLTACSDDDSDFLVGGGNDTESSSSEKAKLSSSSKNKGDDVVLGEMTDERDGHVYKTWKYKGQEWMAENLNYRYLQPTDSLDSSSFCYNDSIQYCEKYGRLYLWSAAVDSAGLFNSDALGEGFMVPSSVKYPVHGICPDGWHLPCEYEWEALRSAVADGRDLRTTDDWTAGGGTDAYSFSVLPGGWRHGGRGEYIDLHEKALFWSSTESYYLGIVNGQEAYYLYFKQSDRTWELFVTNFTIKSAALSIRCIRD